jgi:HlyD family secretion protein
LKQKFIIAAIVLALVGAGLFFFLDSKESAPRFKTEPASDGEIKATVTATGTVNAVTTVLVGTQVSGTIKDIYVDYNSQVKKGQLLALIDPTSFEAQVNQARANLFSARANLQKSIASQEDAKRTMDRNKELLARNLIAQSDYDTARTNYETAVAQVEASRGQVAQTEASLEVAETNLRYTRIVSPVNGTVVSRSVDAGQTVAASFQTPTLFTIAQDLKKMQIDTSVNEADIGRVQVGQDVEFTVDAYPDDTFTGKVTQVRIAPVSVQNVVTYDVVVSVENPDLKLKPGMTANVNIITMVKKDVLRVPNAALRFKPKTKPSEKPETQKKPGQKGPAVYVLKEGEPEMIKVTTGITDGTYTEILPGSALRPGDEVITESLEKEKKADSTRGPRMF